MNEIIIRTGLDTIFNTINDFINGRNDGVDFDTWKDLRTFYEGQLIAIRMMVVSDTPDGKECERLIEELRVKANDMINARFGCSLLDD